MAPKKATAENADGGSVTAFTDGEIKLVKAVFDSMNTRPDIDFEKVANIMGLANAKSARDRFRVVSKKHGWTSTDGSGGAAAGGGGSSKTKGPLAAKNTSKVTKKTAPKKKGIARKKTKEIESDDDEDITNKLESDSDGKTIPKNEPMESSSEDED